MGIKQLSVFIENREGRICDVTKVVKENEIDIKTLSLADTADYGMVRMIVSDPYRGRETLRRNGFSAMLVDVIAVKVEPEVGKLHDFLKVLVDVGVSIEYMYTMYINMEPIIVLKVSDIPLSEEVLNKNGYVLLEENFYK